jgi:hypothetical protein
MEAVEAAYRRRENWGDLVMNFENHTFELVIAVVGGRGPPGIQVARILRFYRIIDVERFARIIPFRVMRCAFGGYN